MVTQDADWVQLDTKTDTLSMVWSKKDVTPLLMHWSYVFLELAHHCVPGLVFNWPCLYLRLPSDIEWTYQIQYIWPHFGWKQVKYIKSICVPSDEIYVKLVQFGSQYSTMLSLGNSPGCYYLCENETFLCIITHYSAKLIARIQIFQCKMYSQNLFLMQSFASKALICV